jgi:hypothetical protein
MRRVALGHPTPGHEIEWIVHALREIENASYEDAVEVADAYSTNSTFTETREINVTAPTTANLAAVLATLILDLQRRGVNRSDL